MIDTTEVRKFLEDIAHSAIVPKHKYSVRIELNDGGYNSYVSLCVDIHDNGKEKGMLECVRIFRHTNGVKEFANAWSFDLGNICHLLEQEPNVPIKFSSYGKTAEEATAEAREYFKELKRLVKKETSDYKKAAAKSEAEEREVLLARLRELGVEPKEAAE